MSVYLDCFDSLENQINYLISIIGEMKNEISLLRREITCLKNTIDR